VKPKSECGHHAEISSAATKSPVKIGIFVGIRFYEPAVSQNFIGRNQIISR
jgi:hypothetical protein